MVDHHHLPPETAGVGHHHHKGGKTAVLADDLKPSHRPRRRFYYYGGDGASGGGLARTLCFVVLVIVLLAGVIALVLYLVYRPTRPDISVTSAAVYYLLNATGTGADAVAGGAAPTLLAASFQFTVVIRNPSGRSTARYDRLTAYVAYRGEPITPPAPMPPLVQNADSAVSLAPVIGGGQPVPVSPEAAAALATDVAFGVVALRVVVLGHVRFVSRPFQSGWCSMYARCDLLVGVRKGAAGGGPAAGGPEEPLLGNPVCSVDM